MFSFLFYFVIFLRIFAFYYISKLENHHFLQRLFKKLNKIICKDVKECVVVLDKMKSTEFLKARVVLENPEKTADFFDFKEKLSKSLKNPHSLPRRFEVVNSIKRNTMGKIDRLNYM